MEPVPQVVPLVRSGELFTKFSVGQQDAYFDAVANAPSYEITPEHVFGVNGWRRRLAETGADPGVVYPMFAESWDSMDPEARRDLVAGNAIARFYGMGVAEGLQESEIARMKSVASAFTDDPNGFASVDDRVAMSQLYQEKILGKADALPDAGPVGSDDFSEEG